MIRFSARSASLLLVPQGRALNRDRALIRDRTLIRDRALIYFFEKQPNVQNKTLINIKITNNNRNRNSNKLLKVQLLLKELFILAVTNIHVRYGECS